RFVLHADQSIRWPSRKRPQGPWGHSQWIPAAQRTSGSREEAPSRRPSLPWLSECDAGPRPSALGGPTAAPGIGSAPRLSLDQSLQNWPRPLVNVPVDPVWPLALEIGSAANREMWNLLISGDIDLGANARCVVCMGTHDDDDLSDSSNLGARLGLPVLLGCC